MVKYDHLHLVCYFIIPLNISVTSVVQMLPTLPKKCPYSEFFWSAFPAFELNKEICRADLCIQSECGKSWTRKNSEHGHVLRNLGLLKVNEGRFENLPIYSCLYKNITLKIWRS